MQKCFLFNICYFVYHLLVYDTFTTCMFWIFHLSFHDLSPSPTVCIHTCLTHIKPLFVPLNHVFENLVLFEFLDFGYNALISS